MAGIDDYSITAASNTAINGIAISNSTFPNQVDDIARQQMADTRRAFNDIGAKATSSGTNTITLTTETVYAANADGTRVTFIAGGTNTGAATLAVDAAAAKAVVKLGGTALSGGEIIIGQPVDVVYDASQGAGSWMLLNPAPATGSWSPELMFNGVSTGITYSTQVGRYVRIGNLVTLFGNVVITSNGSGTGSAQIGNIPFTVATITGYASVGTLGNWLNFSTDNVDMHTYVESADTRIDLLHWGGAGSDEGRTFLTEGDIDDDAAFTFTIQYICA